MNLSLPNDELLRLAWAQLWQVTVLVVAVGLAAHLFCRRRPHLAYVLWLLVIVKSLTPPLLSSPTGVFSWASGVRRAAEVPLAVSPGAETLSTVQESPLAAAAAGGISSPSYPEPALSPTAMLPATDAGRISNPSYPERALSAGAVLLAIWASGAALLAVLILAGWLRCRLRVRQGVMPTPLAMDALVAELTAQLGLRRKVRLVVTSSPLGPATFGWLPPTVVIPASVIAAQGPEQLRPIVAHELIHVRRGDALFGVLQTLAQVVWWFHPLVWWANRRASRAVEGCCDEEAIAALGCKRAAYARSLLEVLQLRISPRSLLAFPGIRPWEVTSNRLERIMKRKGKFRRRMPVWCWAILVLAAAAILPGRGLVVAPEAAVAGRADAGTVAPDRTAGAATEGSKSPCEPVGKKPAQAAAAGDGTSTATVKPAVTTKQKSEPIVARKPGQEVADRGFLVLPITTELQGLAKKPDAVAYVLINGAALTADGKPGDPKPLDRNALREAMKPYAGLNGGSVMFIVRCLMPPGMAEESSTRGVGRMSFGQLLDRRSFGPDLGFPHAQFKFGFRPPSGGADAWSEIVAEVAADLLSDLHRQEAPVGDELVKVYPVRTAISRFEHFGADCVVQIVPPLDDLEPDALKQIPEKIRFYVLKVNLASRHKAVFLFHGKKAEVINQALRQMQLDKHFWESMGFQTHVWTLSD